MIWLFVQDSLFCFVLLYLIQNQQGEWFLKILMSFSVELENRYYYVEFELQKDSKGCPIGYLGEATRGMWRDLEEWQEGHGAAAGREF